MQAFLVGVLAGAPPEGDSSNAIEGLPNVQIVRKHRSPPGQDPNARLKIQTELAAFAIGSAGLTYFVKSMHLMPS